MSALAVLLSLSLPSGCDVARADDRSPRLVWVNAFAVAHPDYRVIHEKIPRPRHDGRSIEIPLEARWPNPTLTMDTRGRRDALLRATPQGGIEAPQTTPWKLTDLLRAVGHSDGRQDVAPAATLLKSLRDADVRVLAVVEFAKPLREDDVRVLWPYQIDVGLFSPAQPMPAAWDYSGHCDARGFDACELGVENSLAGEFAAWVATLTPEDQQALNSFGLDLPTLEASAQQGVYHGMVLNAYPERVLPLTESSEIASVRIADVALVEQ
jgi:hypothetical protein